MDSRTHNADVHEINTFLSSMRAKYKKFSLEYELSNAEEFKPQIDRKEFYVQSAEDVLNILVYAKIDNEIEISDIEISDIEKLRREKKYVIGDKHFLVLIAKSNDNK